MFLSAQLLVTVSVLLCLYQVASGLLVCTPSEDYDDTYLIKYAQKHDGFIISNDMYRYSAMCCALLAICMYVCL